MSQSNHQRLTYNVKRFQHILHVLELFCLQGRVDSVYHVVVRLLLLLLHLRELLEVLLAEKVGSKARLATIA